VTLLNDVRINHPFSLIASLTWSVRAQFPCYLIMSASRDVILLIFRLA